VRGEHRPVTSAPDRWVFAEADDAAGVILNNVLVRLIAGCVSTYSEAGEGLGAVY
jgi:hypothetical protein